ncbi:MAG: class II fructose-bisphosphate aldolase [Ruminococcaceae bacterium]|nr:class II fructose-bisphosphate aldolase [Oscillospiraceae bacterium]
MLVTMNEILPKAQAEHYAVGLFNVLDTSMLQAAIEAAEEARSPIIIGTAEVLCTPAEMELLAPAMVNAAKRASVPVAVHYDHGLTYQRCVDALRLGFSSIMFDGSAGDPAENLAATREMVKIAHSFGCSVEGEIGHVGTIGADESTSDNYTTPEEAVDFVKATGVDALAIAIGTAHGAYKTKPKLDVERLSAIRAALDTPLVLHGGSGLTDDDFRGTIARGITKVNIYTDLCNAAEKATNALSGPYFDIRRQIVDQVRQAILGKMELFGSVGKA